eukprot:59897-Prorocentrum_minimum.AAC.1
MSNPLGKIGHINFATYPDSRSNGCERVSPCPAAPRTATPPASVPPFPSPSSPFAWAAASAMRVCSEMASATARSTCQFTRTIGANSHVTGGTFLLRYRVLHSAK